MAFHAPPPTGNRLLRLLPAPEREAIEASATGERLELKQSIYKIDMPIVDMYFPDTGVASMVRSMEDGAVVEIATVGNEGVVGIEAFLGVTTTPGTAFIQIPGRGWRVPARRLRELAVTGRGCSNCCSSTRRRSSVRSRRTPRATARTRSSNGARGGC
jgi:hypothetical protein